jgi:hypothetical protein
MNETDDDMLRDGNEEDGKVRSQCEENEGTDCESGNSDTDKCRWNWTCFVYEVYEINNKIFFLAVVFLGGLLRFG